MSRALSSHGELREDAQKEGLAGPNKTIDLAGEDKAAFVEDVRKALFASKVVAYAQGLNEIQDGAKEYGWDINLSEVARIWRGGCIIRAQFLLDRITEAFRGDNPPASLLFDPYFEKIIGESQDAWRRVIVRAVEAGIPTPVFSSSLAYYDGLRSKRLPTALTQSQRDFFGAHTYGRVDKPGVSTPSGPKRVSPRSRRSLAISGLRGARWAPRPSSERGGYAAEPTLSLAAGESLIAGAGGEEGKSEIEA